MNAMQQRRQSHAAGNRGISQKDMKRLMGRMRSLKNEMDFLEIMSNFWPLSNMEARVNRLEKEMDSLNRLYSVHQQELRPSRK